MILRCSFQATNSNECLKNKIEYYWVDRSILNINKKLIIGKSINKNGLLKILNCLDFKKLIYKNSYCSCFILKKSINATIIIILTLLSFWFFNPSHLYCQILNFHLGLYNKFLKSLIAPLILDLVLSKKSTFFNHS